MIEELRVVLVDPDARSGQDLPKQISSIDDINLVDVINNSAIAYKRISTLVPDIVILVIDDEADLDFPCYIVESIRSAFPSMAVIVIGSDRDVNVILRLIRAGAREYLPTTFSTLELIEAIQRIRPRSETPVAKGPQVIAVTGAAGGIGCSTVAVNLATSLAKLSRRDTVIADFDLLVGSLEECLGVIPDNSLEGMIRNIDDMDSVLLKRWLPRHPSGLFVLPHPVTLEESVNLDPNDIRSVIELLRETFASVVIDTSKGLQSSDFLAFEAADIIIVVFQLTLNCVRNTIRLIQYLRSFEGLGDKIRFVVNRSTSPLSEISLKRAEELLKSPIHWSIPNATKIVMPARASGVPIDEVAGGAGSKPHQMFLMMAQALQPFPTDPSKAKKKAFSAFR